MVNKKTRYPINGESDETTLTNVIFTLVYLFKLEIKKEHVLGKIKTNTQQDRLLKLAELVEEIGLSATYSTIAIDDTPHITTYPCVLAIDNNQFIVIENILGDVILTAKVVNSVIVRDKLELSTFISNFRSTHQDLIIFNFKNDLREPEEINQRSFLRFFYSLIKQYRSIFFQISIGLLFSSLIQVAFPFLTQSVVDIGITTRDINFIYLILAAQLALFVGRTAIEILRRWFLLHLSIRINITMLSEFIRKLTLLSPAFYHAKSIGDTMQRIYDHKRIEQLLSTTTLNSVFSLFNLIVFSGILLYYNLSIFLLFVSLTVFYFVYVALFLKKRKEYDHKTFEAYSQDHTKVYEVLAGMTEIKLNNAQMKMRLDWANIQSYVFQLRKKSTVITQIQEVGSQFVNELKNILITILAATAVIDGSMSLGAMVAIQYIIGSLNGPVVQLISFIQEYQNALIGFGRINEIKALPEEDGQIKGYMFSKVDFDHRGDDGSIELRNVCFRYNEKGPDILNNLNLIIPQGKTTAIVGLSGSGKTTLFKILLKLFEPSNGQITVNGFDLRYINSTFWRSRCGVVMQDGYIFNDTIANNICLNELSQTMSIRKLIDAAEAANVLQVINGLENGFNAKIGFNGIGLSGGQRQRLLIARAIYKEPDYFFFDEATSSLDTETELAIVKNLRHYLKGKTAVIIAHRLSTIKNADQIVVLSKGEVVEVGTHETLFAQQKIYYSLMKDQLQMSV